MIQNKGKQEKNRIKNDTEQGQARGEQKNNECRKANDYSIIIIKFLCYQHSRVRL